MARFALVCALLSGCEFAFPIVLDVDAEEAEIPDAGPTDAPAAKDVNDDRRDAGFWDHKTGS